MARPAFGNIDKEKVLQNLQFGWSSIVETTKQTVSNTKQFVEVTNAKLEENFALRKKGFYKRDRKLPLDTDSLRDAEVVRRDTLSWIEFAPLELTPSHFAVAIHYRSDCNHGPSSHAVERLSHDYS